MTIHVIHVAPGYQHQLTARTGIIRGRSLKYLVCNKITVECPQITLKGSGTVETYVASQQEFGCVLN